MTIFKSLFTRCRTHTVLYAAFSLLLAACGGSGTTDPTTTGDTATRLLATSTSSTAVAPYGQDGRLFTLSFSDEFDSGLNTSLWSDHIFYDKGNSTKNYVVENGSLKVWPQRDASGKFFNRTISTDGHFTQTYGYFEIEAKLPRGKGTWPGFWLFNHVGTRRPEIDVMEAYAGGLAPWGITAADGTRHSTMYGITIWQDAKIQKGFKKVSTPDLTTGFHKYAIKWEPNKQTYYFDGREVYVVPVTMPDPMFMMVDLWFGSASGTPDTSTPQGKTNSYEVNYVRVWKFT